MLNRTWQKYEVEDCLYRIAKDLGLKKLQSFNKTPRQKIQKSPRIIMRRLVLPFHQLKKQLPAYF